MPNTAEEDRLESRASAFTALLTLVCGLFLMSVSFRGMHSEAVDILDDLVKFDTAYPGQMAGSDIPPLTTKRIMQSLFWMSILVVVAAVIGIVGSMLRQKGPVCVYVVLASALSLVVLVSAAQTSQRRILAAPMLMRQVEDICMPVRYIRLTHTLGCDFAKVYDEAEMKHPCGPYCQFRVQALQEFHGCEVLPKLCTSFTYEELQSGGCLSAALQTGMAVYRHTGLPMSADDCHAACDNDIGCSTVINLLHEGSGQAQCMVLSARASFHSTANWTEVGQGARLYLGKHGNATGTVNGWTHQCFRRAQPRVLVEFMDCGLRLAVATASLGVALLLSVFCTFCILYNVNMSRRGLPTALELGLMMLCPCCSHHVHRRFHEDYFEKDFAEGDSDGEEEDSDDECME